MEMGGHVDYCIMEEVQAATGVDFETKVMAKERLRLPARMKGGRDKMSHGHQVPSVPGGFAGHFTKMRGREGN